MGRVDFGPSPSRVEGLVEKGVVCNLVWTMVWTWSRTKAELQVKWAMCQAMGSGTHYRSVQG